MEILGCQRCGMQALPPWAQEAREIEAIKNDPRLVELIGNAVILDIQKTGHSYILYTAIGEVRVDVNYLPAENCGPAKFELVFPTE